MGTIDEIRAALDAVEAADTQLEEVHALVAVNRLVRTATRVALNAAVAEHGPTAVARAAGTSRQNMQRRRAVA